MVFVWSLETREEAERAPADVNSPDEPGENGHASTERLPQQQQQQRHPGKFRSSGRLSLARPLSLISGVPF